jgi:hypothetical protein
MSYTVLVTTGVVCYRFVLNVTQGIGTCGNRLSLPWFQLWEKHAWWWSQFKEPPSDLLLEVPRDCRLRQKVHRACDKDSRCPYTLAPHRELYHGFNICIPPEQWNLVDRLTGHGQPFLTSLTSRPGPLNSASATSSLSSASMHNPSSQGTAVRIIHGVVPKPVLKEVTENEGSVWVRY